MVIPTEPVSPSGRWVGVFHHSDLKTSTAYDTAPCLLPSSGFLSMGLNNGVLFPPRAYTGETTLRLVVPFILGGHALNLRGL